MTHHASIRTLFAFALAAAAASSCSSTPTGVAALAGRYELRSVDGRAVPVDALGGALGGELQLGADSRVTRVVRYATSGIPGPIVNRSTGTYRVRGSQITLTLTPHHYHHSTTSREGRTAALDRWQVSGDVQLSTLVLRYRGRAERMVEERWVRVAGRG